MKKEVEKILQEIFDPFILGNDIKSHKLTRSPNFQEIQDFAELILLDESEETFQKFLSLNSHFLFRLGLSTDETAPGIL